MITKLTMITKAFGFPFFVNIVVFVSVVMTS
jgi:hypothetical protein